MPSRRLRDYLPHPRAGRRHPRRCPDRKRQPPALPRGTAASRPSFKSTLADAEKQLPNVKCPALVIMGTLDPDFAGPQAEGDAIVAAMPAGAGTVAMIDGAGHYPHAQSPRRSPHWSSRSSRNTPVPSAGKASSAEGVVAGVPRRWLGLEGLVLLAGALIAFGALGQPWRFVPAGIPASEPAGDAGSANLACGPEIPPSRSACPGPQPGRVALAS